jgi:hypothetical protein
MKRASLPLRRREFITLLGGAAVSWPRVIWAQQSSIPVIGYLSTLSEAQVRGSVDAFRRGLVTPGSSRDATPALYTAMLRGSTSASQAWRLSWLRDLSR